MFYTSKTIDPVGITTVNTITMRCNHPAFTAIENKDTRYWLNPEADDICCFLPGGMSQVFLRSTSNFTTVAECKAYLGAQYDNGTPVKISYWLKTPVEEDPPVPSRYPDYQGETIDYDGTPKPSQMYVKVQGVTAHEIHHMFLSWLGLAFADFVTGYIKAKMRRTRYRARRFVSAGFTRSRSLSSWGTAIGLTVGLDMLGRYYNDTRLTDIAGMFTALSVFVYITVMEIIYENFDMPKAWAEDFETAEKLREGEGEK